MWMMDMTAIVGILAVFVPTGAVVFSLTPIGRAIAQRIKGQCDIDSARFDEIQSALFDLRDAVERIGADYTELQDRVSFAERLLVTSGSERDSVLTPV